MLGFVLIQSKLNCKKRKPSGSAGCKDCLWTLTEASDVKVKCTLCTFIVPFELAGFYFSNLFIEMVMTKIKRKALY